MNKLLFEVSLAKMCGHPMAIRYTKLRLSNVVKMFLECCTLQLAKIEDTQDIRALHYRPSASLSSCVAQQVSDVL